MIAIGLFAVWGFYGVGTWGWILVKGYNITLWEWFNPARPYEWPQGGPPMVPPGHLFPTGQAAPAKQIQTAGVAAAAASGASKYPGK